MKLSIKFAALVLLSALAAPGQQDLLNMRGVDP
jgi:hypothetical protein